MALTSWDMMDPTLSIWDSIKARNPRLNVFDLWAIKDEFEVIAYKNESQVKPLLIGNKKNKVKINASTKAIFGDQMQYMKRPNGTSQDRDNG